MSSIEASESSTLVGIVVSKPWVETCINSPKTGLVPITNVLLYRNVG